jgi:hypothetical protein
VIVKKFRSVELRGSVSAISVPIVTLRDGQANPFGSLQPSPTAAPTLCKHITRNRRTLESLSSAVSNRPSAGAGHTGVIGV